MLPLLDEDWRPDRSEILIVFDNEGIPAAYRERPGVKLLLLGGDGLIRRPGFLQYVAGLVDGEVPAFIGVPGPPGHFGVKAFLNDRLKEAVRRRDGTAMAAVVSELLAVLRRGAFEPVTFEGPAPGM
jgi:hypothetical protein